MLHSSRCLLSTILPMCLSAAISLTGSTAVADTQRIMLSTGEILHVNILERNTETIRFNHPVLGEVTLPANAAQVLPQEPDAHPEEDPDIERRTQSETSGADVQTHLPTEASDADLEEVTARAWKFRLTLAGASASGNTESANFSTIFAATRDTPQSKTVFDASYFYGERDGSSSENRFSTGVRHDWLNPESKWFQFITARYDHDKFQSWDHRVQGHVGIGRHLIEPPKLRLDLLAGAGAVKEWGSENDDVRPEALLGIDGEYAFAEEHTLKFSSTIFPDLSELDDYRVVNTLAWAWSLDNTRNLALTAGLQHEYQSQVDAGRDRNDLRVYAGVQLDF